MGPGSLVAKEDRSSLERMSRPVETLREHLMGEYLPGPDSSEHRESTSTCLCKPRSQGYDLDRYEVDTTRVQG